MTASRAVLAITVSRLRPCRRAARARKAALRFRLMGQPDFAILFGVGAKPAKLEERIMSWKTPKIVEVSLALEINSYASADLS